jgi:hypothetical protein
MLSRMLDAGSAGLLVGYVSASQFRKEGFAFPVSSETTLHSRGG